MRTGCRSPFSPGSFISSCDYAQGVAQKVILDVDTGTDDAVAIMFAALHPELELVGVTTVNGNVPVHHCTDNSLRVLDFIGRSDVPVYEGLARPLVRLDFPTPKSFGRDSAEDMHGTELPIPLRRASSKTPARSSSSSRPCARRRSRSPSCPSGR